MDATVEEINRDLKARRAPPRRPAGEPPVFAILKALGEVLPPEALVQGIFLEMRKGERPGLLLELAQGSDDLVAALSRSPLFGPGPVAVESGENGLTRYRCTVAMEPQP